MNTFIKQVQETIVEAVKSIKNNIYRADVKLIDQQIIEDRLDDIKTASKGIEKAIKEIPLTEKIEVTNQKDVETKLEDIKKLQGNIIKAIHDIPETKKIEVTNPDDFPYPQSIEVDNLDVITNVLDKIQTVLSKLPTEYPVTKIPEYPITKIPKFPESVKVSNLETLQGEDPKKYVPVRITNGKEFIEVLQNIATNFINPLRSSINRLTGRLEVDVITMPPVTVDATGLAQETTLSGIKTQIDKLTFTGTDLNVTGGGGGGGGGAVTIADGADVAQGTTTDTAYTTGSGTIVSILKGIFSKLLTKGQATMTNSAPVVIASDQSAISVTGTFWQATQPISGSVTANAGTNLNTSLLALEAGGNLATIASKDFATQTTLALIKSKTDNIPPLGQALAAASTPVVLTAAQITTLTPPAAITGYATSALQTTQDTSINTLLKPASTLAAVTTVSTVTNLSQQGGVAISLNTGVRDAGTQRVTIATNDVVPVTGTFWQTTQPISAASLPLPTGASTSANQTAQSTLFGAVTETAPATDTASSGLNGRLQRIAQRITSLIALIPAALTASGNFKVSLQESNASQAVTGTFYQATQPVSGPLTDTQLRATAVPVSGTLIANPTTPTAPKYGRATMVVTNTAVQLASNAVTGVIIQALSTNTSSIYIGDASVTTANGFELQAGQATSVAIDNTNRLYINGTATDKVCFIGS